MYIGGTTYVTHGQFPTREITLFVERGGYVTYGQLPMGDIALLVPRGGIGFVTHGQLPMSDIGDLFLEEDCPTFPEKQTGSAL